MPVGLIPPAGKQVILALRRLENFQFIQDPLDYGNVTHHTNQDVYERLQPDDMKFNAAVVASFAWQAAQRDEKLPRPPEPGAEAGRGGR